MCEAQIKLKYPSESKFMKILAVVFLAMFTGLPAEAGPQATRGIFSALLLSALTWAALISLPGPAVIFIAISTTEMEVS